MGSYELSQNDIDEVLKLEKRHFGALSGQGMVQTALKNYQKAIDSYIEAHKIQLAHTFPEVISALQGSSIKTIKLREAGENLLTVAVPIQKYKRVLGVLLLSMKDEKVNATFSSYQKELIIAVIIALIITSALSLYLSRSITKPILSLASAAERIKNDRSDRSEIPEVSKRNDELGDLSKALIEMTNNLWQRFDSICK